MSCHDDVNYDIVSCYHGDIILMLYYTDICMGIYIVEKIW